jgi:putative phosphoesterase
MKICILSDSHDNRQLMAAAVADAKARGAEAVLHCGDVVAPTTLRILQKYELPVHVIHGNNTGDMYSMTRLAAEPGSVVRYHGQDAGITLGGRHIFIVHYPHYAKAMACTGDYDLVCFGHEHKPELYRVDTVKGGQTWLVNPGTVGGVGHAPTYVLADLQTLEFETLPVPVPEVVPSEQPRVTPHV